jgi:hypothetical protein
VSLRVRKVALIVNTALGFAVITRLLLDWILGLEGPLVALAVASMAALGAIAALGDARTLKPMDARERRDAYVGWTVVIGAALTAVSFALPGPWAFVAAGVVIVLTALALRFGPPEPEA